jgi:hypothetical protein
MTESTTLLSRLALLPPKVAVPFRDLLNRGHIGDEVLTSVLDAGDIVRDQSRLLGFAIAFMQMRHSGVPIADVINMAKSQGRRIRLDWSANRWRAEHDRLSRAEALSRLAEENVTYDVSDYAPHLPDRFPGYLIGSSRRLGMEGLRQRHCVASYHSQLTRNYCAIASVFIDKTRWTVQLNKTNNDDRPLRISQIRSRLNRTPSPDVRSAIHDALGIEEYTPVPSQPARRFAQPDYMDKLRRVLPVLRDNGVNEVTVYFDGSGDSGSIDTVIYDPIEFDGSEIRVTIPIPHHENVNDQWITVTEDTECSIDEAITQVTDQYLSETGVDWYNNDGGFGELKIHVAEGTVGLDIETRYTQTNTEHSTVRDIETGEEVD